MVSLDDDRLGLVLLAATDGWREHIKDNVSLYHGQSNVEGYLQPQQDARVPFLGLQECTNLHSQGCYKTSDAAVRM